MDKGKESRNKHIEIKNFKGMETVIDSSDLGIDVAADAVNVSFLVDGGISKREGTKVYKQIPNVEWFDKLSMNSIKAESLEFTNSNEALQTAAVPFYLNHGFVQTDVDIPQDNLMASLNDKISFGYKHENNKDFLVVTSTFKGSWQTREFPITIDKTPGNDNNTFIAVIKDNLCIFSKPAPFGSWTIIGGLYKQYKINKDYSLTEVKNPSTFFKSLGSKIYKTLLDNSNIDATFHLPDRKFILMAINGIDNEVTFTFDMELPGQSPSVVYVRVFNDDARPVEYGATYKDYSQLNGKSALNVIKFDTPTNIAEIGLKTGKTAEEMLKTLNRGIYFLDDQFNAIDKLHDLSPYTGNKMVWTNKASIKNVKYIIAPGGFDLNEYIQSVTAYVHATTTQAATVNYIKHGTFSDIRKITVAFKSQGSLRQLSFFDETEKNINNVISVIGENSNMESFLSLDQDEFVYSSAYINGTLIISTNKEIYSATLLQVNSTNHNIKYLMAISTIDKLADNVSYEEIKYNGINILKKNPFNLETKVSELTGKPWGIKDLFIAKHGTSELVISPEIGKSYDVKCQVFTPYDASNRNILQFEWKIFEIGTDGISKAIDNTGDKFFTGKGTDTITIKPDQLKGINYRISVKVTSSNPNDPNNAYPAIEREINFKPDIPKVTQPINYADIVNEIKQCKYVKNLDGRLVAYGNGLRRIYTSEQDRPFYFTIDELVVADSFGKAEELVRIETFKDTHIVFTNSTMMSMTRINEKDLGNFWSIQPLDGAVGIVGHLAATPIANTLAFVDRNGVYIIGQVSVAQHRVDLVKVSLAISDLALPYKDLFDKNNETLFNDIVVGDAEHRLFVSYPQKNFVLVYDYTLGLDKGKWAKWVWITPNRIVNFENSLYFTKNKKDNIFVKFPRIESEIYNYDFDVEFFQDNGIDYPFIYETTSSNLNEDFQAKKIKRVMFKMDNVKQGSNNVTFSSTSDGLPDLYQEFESTVFNKPIIGTFTLGKRITHYRPSDNIYSKIFMKSKPGRTLSLKLESNNEKPITITMLRIDYIDSKVKPLQISGIYSKHNIKNK